MSPTIRNLVAAVAIASLTVTASAQIVVTGSAGGPGNWLFGTIVNGNIRGDGYGEALSVQAVQTQFGDNLSELNAAYAMISGGRLFLALTGNLENNFNKLEIFFDTKPGGENVFTGVPGNDNTGVMTGLTFDSGFEPDYHIIVRRGFFKGDKFDLDIAVLGTPDFSSYIDVFGGVTEGRGTTGTGPGNASPIEVAYDDSNRAGVGEGTGAADQDAALAVETGFEMSVDLGDIGNPAGSFKIQAWVNGNNHNFASNQFLGPLVPPQSNLGGDGNGNFTGVLNFDLNDFQGEQWFLFGTCDPCDMNCDGDIDAFDIEPFLDLLFGGEDPCCGVRGEPPFTGDADGDGDIDAFDIEPFLNCLFP